MKIIAFTPSRLNSQRLPKKNIKMLGGIPLVNYALMTMNKVELVHEIVLFSSEPTICDFIKKEVKYKFQMRPASLDNHGAKVQDLVREFLKVYDVDIIVMFHLTSPFLRAETISECVNKVKNEGYDAAFTALLVNKRCWFRGSILNESGKDCDGFKRTPVVVEHSLYVFKKHIFEQNEQRICKNSYIKYVDQFEGHDIDTPEEFRVAELMVQSGLVEGI